jgi:phospholipase D-like protein
MRIKVDPSTLPLGVLIALGVVLLLEIALDAVALVDLYRRPIATVAFRNKWIWVALIVLINPIGAVLYLATGRRSVPALEETAVGPKRSNADVADALYGTGDELKQQ